MHYPTRSVIFGGCSYVERLFTSKSMVLVELAEVYFGCSKRSLSLGKSDKAKGSERGIQ